MANHEEKEWLWQGKKYKCKPGQLVTSLKSVAKASGTSIQNVRTALINFEKTYDFLTSISTNKNRLITITNWELYQAKDIKPTKRATSNQQAPNKQLTTNKNDKEYKNDKEVSSTDFSNYDFSKTTKEKITEWITYKKEKRDTYTPTGLKSLLTQIEKNITAHGEQKIIDLIDECMAAGYKGIIWDKLKKPQFKQDKPARRDNFEQRQYDDNFYDKLNQSTIIGGKTHE